MADLALAPVAAKTQFVHLKVHSSYSLLEGALSVEKLAKFALADGQVAMALTDTGNLFGALEFSEKLSSLGIQPIIGCSLLVDFEEKAKGPEALTADRSDAKLATGRLAFLAKDETGYANLMALTSMSYLETPDGDEARVLLSDVGKHREGLIVLSGGPDGGIDWMIAAGKLVIARKRLERLKKLFGNRLYVELQRHGEEREQAVEPELVGLAHELELPLVATNEAYFPEAGDYDAHDALICIAEGSYISEDSRRRLSREHFFKSQAQMARLFADLPEAIASTIEIAERCSYRPRTRKPILPQFVETPQGSSKEAQLAAEGAELRRQAEEGLERRLQTAGPAAGETVENYRARLAFELDVITRMTYQGYFLIVADFIKWAKAQGIPVGPGRGSGAGSVVAWALTITDLDPMRFGLLFERFLNPERVSMPDFDRSEEAHV